ncbi:ribosome recycling factor [Leptolyngbya sp. 15MV]|nr:ribosome recycling factor [Leptolyngbya sp. 15MV]
MTPDSILQQAEQSMVKGLDHLKHELKGIRTGRASPAMVEYVKVNAYGSSTDLKGLASISVPEPTQLLIKPFDATLVGEIKKGIEAAGLGFNPIVEGKQLRINIPALSGDRRKQLVDKAKKLGEDTKVVLRNSRRDANKHADQLKASGKFPEDEIKQLKTEIDELLKKYEAESDKLVAEKSKDITTL